MVSHVTRVVTEARVTRHIVSYPDFAQTRLSTPGYEQYGVWDPVPGNIGNIGTQADGGLQQERESHT